jgi:hypothetical protein
MPIVPCRDCGKPISNFAPTCTGCGYPMSAPQRVPGVSAIASGVFIGMFMFSIIAAIGGFIITVLFAGAIAGAVSGH